MNNRSPVKIDKDVPIPHARGDEFPFFEMEVGDSLLVRLDQAAVARGQMFATAKAHARQYVSRAREGGVRIWRVK